MEIHHLGIAVQDLQEAARPYLELGYTLEAQGSIESQGLEIWMLKSGRSRLELLKATRSDSTIIRFIEKRGPGLHHLALATSNIQAELKRLASCGAHLIDSAPRPGFGGHQVAFIHPQWSGGVLVELVEVH